MDFSNFQVTYFESRFLLFSLNQNCSNRKTLEEEILKKKKTLGTEMSVKLSNQKLELNFKYILNS